MTINLLPEPRTLASASAFARMLPGLALSGALAATGIALGRIAWLQDHGFSALTLAIVLGMIVGNTVYPWAPRLAVASGAGVITKYPAARLFSCSLAAGIIFCRQYRDGRAGQDLPAYDHHADDALLAAQPMEAHSCPYDRADRGRRAHGPREGGGCRVGRWVGRAYLSPFS